MPRLGQYFLKSKETIKTIVKTANIQKNDIILEVGPGKGALTEALLKKAKKVIAVEKDPRLQKYLKEKFKNYKNLKLISGDILKTKFKITNFKIVANIPYYITSRFLRQFLERKNQPKLIVLMVQKEVAARITAKPPKMNLLALSVQVYGEPKIIKIVPRKFFSPQPKVNSAVIKIENISKNFFKENKIKEKKFFSLVKKGFASKRKILKNNLSIPEKIFEGCKISPRARAQELTLEDWKCLIEKTDF